MSIALSRSRNQIGGSGFIHGMSCLSAFESPLIGGRRFPADADHAIGKDREESCSSSSIGNDSDLSSGKSLDGDDSGEAEVQSSHKTSFDSIQALEEVLPIRRGISKFYNGKSKSFASLAEASTVEDVVKPENAYTRKRRNLLASNLLWDKDKSKSGSLLRITSSNGNGISKRPSNSTPQTTLALAIAMGNSSEDEKTKPKPKRSPRHAIARTQNEGSFSPWRSFSLADLQQCAGGANTAQITINNKII